MSGCSRNEWMTIAAARLLRDKSVCFVGIGLPSAACNLARLTHAPSLVLIYESGTIGTRPRVLPLSIGDGELAETAAYVVPLPEVFSYYLQAGRVDVGFLGAAQIDRYGNLNSTVIGPYDKPTTRLPGAGGAPEIAWHAKQVFVMAKATKRSFVERLDFCTSAGYLEGHGARARSGAPGGGPRAVITDFGMLAPHPQTDELQLIALFADASVEEARAAVGWPLALADEIDTIAPPTAHELDTLRALFAHTREAHSRPVHLPLPPEGLP
ncbi:CoA-transferase subunit beta [Dyella humicola]|uniref:CoA-transferase subunit beta n=1 Tax=Dyella humicola TaxID=2992126 RepID=UPI00224D81FA|nr:CoA-transferase [Dyella humicola]